MKYGNDIIVKIKQHKKSIVCFRNTGYNLLTQAWYDGRKTDPTEEKRPSTPHITQFLATTSPYLQYKILCTTERMLN